MVDASLRHPDRRFGGRKGAPGGQLLRYLYRRHPRQTLAHRSRVRGLDRPGAQAGGPVRVPDPGRAAADQRPRGDLLARGQGGDFRRRSGVTASRATQQGHGGLSYPLRLRSRRQRLRGHGIPDRAVQGGGSQRPQQSETWTGPQGHGHKVRAGVRRGAGEAQGTRRRTDAGAALHQPPGVQGQAGQRRPARSVRAQPVRQAWRVQRVPRLLQHAGAGAVRRERHAQRVLRQRRCGDRGAAAEDAVGAAIRPAASAASNWRRRRSRSSCTAA